MPGLGAKTRTPRVSEALCVRVEGGDGCGVADCKLTRRSNGPWRVSRPRIDS